MGVAGNSDFDEFVDDDFESEESFDYVEEAANRRRPQKQRKTKASWRSVEDYMESRRLKRQLADAFDDDWN